jgi:hypothetical protein
MTCTCTKNGKASPSKNKVEISTKRKKSCGKPRIRWDIGEAQITPFLTSSLDGGVSYTPWPLYLRGTSPLCPLYRRLAGPQSRCGRCGVQKIFPLPAVEPRPSIPWPVTVRTSLSGPLWLVNWNFCEVVNLFTTFQETLFQCWNTALGVLQISLEWVVGFSVYCDMLIRCILRHLYKLFCDLGRRSGFQSKVESHVATDGQPVFVSTPPPPSPEAHNEVTACIDAVFIVVGVLYALTDLSLSALSGHYHYILLFINALPRGCMNYAKFLCWEEGQVLQWAQGLGLPMFNCNIPSSCSRHTG